MASNEQGFLLFVPLIRSQKYINSIRVRESSEVIFNKKNVVVDEQRSNQHKQKKQERINVLVKILTLSTCFMSLLLICDSMMADV